MHCKVALICLLSITAINAHVIPRFNHSTYHSEAERELQLPSSIEKPLRHLLHSFKDYGKPKLLSNGSLGSEQPDWLNRNESSVADNVTNVQQTINDCMNKLKGFAATLALQNKAKNRVVRSTIALNLGKVENDSTDGESTVNKEKLKNLLSSIFDEDSTDGESTANKEKLGNLLSSIVDEDSTNGESTAIKEKLMNILLSVFKKDSTDSESTANKEKLKNLLSSIREEDTTDSGSTGDEDGDEEYMRKFISSIFEDEITNYLPNIIHEELESQLPSILEESVLNILSNIFDENSTDTDSDEEETTWTDVIKWILAIFYIVTNA
ncbi:uncharacterized protein LOC128922410 [Zeugodacus cucurbitae]|uniref:uncharacterized protein LOC128922410 n=1 Tax=Zeugodacus cucurbitae TaxID=28588 RepID=UPI0023D93B69|nr:uncharacterized protein LOC128922410 [Zeugodacus cucurbitae]